MSLKKVQVHLSVLIVFFVALSLASYSASKSNSIYSIKFSGEATHYGVSVGDRYIWKHHDNSTMQYDITYIHSEANWEYVNATMYYHDPNSHYSFTDSRLIAAWDPNSETSHDGYIWAIPVNFSRINDSAYLRFYNGDIINEDGLTMHVTYSSYPYYSCNYTLSKNGITTRYEIRDEINSTSWYELVYSNHINNLNAGESASITSPSTNNTEVMLNITTKDATNITVASMVDNPTNVSLENATVFININTTNSLAIIFPVTLQVTYNESAITAAGLKESELKIVYFNHEKSRWESVPSTIDESANTITATLNHFSTYALTTGSFPESTTNQVPGSPALLTLFVLFCTVAMISWQVTRKSRKNAV
ncbi:MAG: hypothetical protein ACTSVI_02490 [Promethearchaeota archaeon]